MSGDGACPPAWVYAMLYHPDEATNLVKTPEDALSHALAVQRLARLMVLGMNNPDEVNDGDEELLAHLSQYGWLWTRRAKELLSAQPTTVAVHPPLGEPVTYGDRGADCPVCGAAIMRTGPNRKHGHSGNWEDHVSCNLCDVKMHEECYYGRVVTLAEWQAYRRHVAGGPEEYQGPPVVCAQCRAKGESA
jgi:hypothetical protein